MKKKQIFGLISVLIALAFIFASCQPQEVIKTVEVVVTQEVEVEVETIVTEEVIVSEEVQVTVEVEVPADSEIINIVARCKASPPH